MIQSVILVTGLTEYPYLSQSLLNHNPILQVYHAGTSRALEEVCKVVSRVDNAARLITFCTNVIVPEHIIQSFSATGYNFHPGPPAYPGSCSANFAIYERARTYGVTAHELTPAVDDGAIVAVRSFPLAPEITSHDLQAQAYTELAGMFHELAQFLTAVDFRLPRTDHQWTKPSRTHAEALELGQTNGVQGLSREETKHRKRAFGDLFA